MKDDSLNDTQQDKGGYCPMCGTVYDKPHECVGKQMSREDIKAVGPQASKLTDRESYRLINIDKALDTNVYERQIWNIAIEAAAKLFPYGEWEEINIAAKIRKLKK